MGGGKKPTRGHGRLETVEIEGLNRWAEIKAHRGLGRLKTEEGKGFNRMGGGLEIKLLKNKDVSNIFNSYCPCLYRCYTHTEYTKE